MTQLFQKPVINLKTMVKIISFLLVLSGLSFSVFSQGTSMAVANAGASATVIEPVSVTSDLGNGTIIFAGTVLLTPVQAHAKSGSISLPVSTGSFTGAFFNIAGTAGYTFTINVSSSPLIIHNGANTLKITSFNSEPALIAGPDMIAGVYVSYTPLNVTVNYN